MSQAPTERVAASVPLRDTEAAQSDAPLVEIEFVNNGHLADGMFSTVHSVAVTSWRRRAAEPDAEPEPAPGTVLALKRTRQEFEFHALLVHPHILRVHAFWFANADERGHTLHMLLSPVLPQTLADLPTPLPIHQTKTYTKQLLGALAYMHAPARRIVHRDFKARNVLVDARAGRAVLCDFGCATRIRAGARNTATYGHRSARASEALFGAETYGCNIDVYALGLLVATMHGAPLVSHCESDAEQVAETVRVFGRPTREEMREMQVEEQKVPAGEEREEGNTEMVRALGMPEDMCELVGHMLELSPRRRVEAEEALGHAALADV